MFYKKQSKATFGQLKAVATRLMAGWLHAFAAFACLLLGRSRQAAAAKQAKQVLGVRVRAGRDEGIGT